LIASILPLKRLDPQEAIKRVRFIQKQNHAKNPNKFGTRMHHPRKLAKTR